MNKYQHDHLLAKQFFHQTLSNVFNSFDEPNLGNFFNMCYTLDPLGTYHQLYPITKRRLIGYVLIITVPKHIESQFKTKTRVYVSTDQQQFITRHNKNTEFCSPIDGDLSALLTFYTAHQALEAPYDFMILDIDLPYTQEAVVATLDDINKTLSDPDQFDTDDELQDWFNIKKSKPSKFLLDLEEGR